MVVRSVLFKSKEKSEECKVKLGFIGLGIMGEAMATNLIKKRNEKVFIYDIDKSKVKKLSDLGGLGLNSNQEVFEKADIIFLSVPNSSILQTIYEEIQEQIFEGKIVIDMSTISPLDSKRFSEMLQKNNATMLDAPVVKSKEAAISGTLGIYVGGDKNTFEKIEEYLEVLGSSVIYIGESGLGSTMKICHNMLVGQIQNGVNEMMVLANELGIDWKTFEESIAIGGGKNLYLESKAENIGKGDFTTAFSIENMHKDVTIANTLIDRMGLNLPGTSVVGQVYNEAIEKEIGREDFSATYKIVKDKSNNKA